MIDATHDVKRRSWVESANGHPDFPIQNLPFGIYSKAGERPRGGVAIGDDIFDLKIASEAGLFSGEAKRAADAAGGQRLNALFALGAGPRAALRARLSELLDADGSERKQAEGMKPLLLTRAAECQMHLPARIGNFTDFYAGIHHATNSGRLLRPDNPLLPNYKHIPVAYHARASSIRVSGTEVRRPSGQRKPQSATEPDFGPCRYLDYELEMGVWIGPGNALGAPIPVGAAGSHVAGFCLLNDWSARDIQAWEYQPLGPFLGKSFATSVSHWVVPLDQLADRRMAREAQDPQPLDYLREEPWAYDIPLEVELNGTVVARSNTRHLYWSIAQQLAHLTVNGASLRTGDLLATGTISGPEPEARGSLIELSWNGQEPIELADASTRTFLEDGDEVILRGEPLGEVSGRIEPALG